MNKGSNKLHQKNGILQPENNLNQLTRPMSNLYWRHIWVSCVAMGTRDKLELGWGSVGNLAYILSNCNENGWLHWCVVLLNRSLGLGAFLGRRSGHLILAPRPCGSWDYVLCLDDVLEQLRFSACSNCAAGRSGSPFTTIRSPGGVFHNTLMEYTEWRAGIYVLSRHKKENQ